MITLLFSLVSAAAQLGAPAPAFTLTATDGTTHSLSSYAGRTVVLEWFNPGCPYVQHAHGKGGVLDGLARRTGEKGVVWLAINSNVPGTQGHGAELNRDAASKWNMAHPVLLDETGATGKAYGATNTPHMFVIDPRGVLVYQGAIDNRPMGKGDGAHVNYVEKALTDLDAGRPVATAETKPYGCSVKYEAK
jgi:peroxiredoxin